MGDIIKRVIKSIIRLCSHDCHYTPPEKEFNLERNGLQDFTFCALLIPRAAAGYVKSGARPGRRPGQGWWDCAAGSRNFENQN
jgi:hypothetical protein